MNYQQPSEDRVADNSSPKRLAIITYDCNRAVITCRLNIIVFDIEALNIDNKVERLSLNWVADKQLDMVIGRFKGSFLYTVSTVIKLGCQEVNIISYKH